MCCGQLITQPTSNAVDIKAFANSRSLRESYFHFANVQKAVSFVKSFSVDECLEPHYW